MSLCLGIFNFSLSCLYWTSWRQGSCQLSATVTTFCLSLPCLLSLLQWNCFFESHCDPGNSKGLSWFFPVWPLERQPIKAAILDNELVSINTSGNSIKTSLKTFVLFVLLLFISSSWTTHDLSGLKWFTLLYKFSQYLWNNYSSSAFKGFFGGQGVHYFDISLALFCCPKL